MINVWIKHGAPRLYDNEVTELITETSTYI